MMVQYLRNSCDGTYMGPFLKLMRRRHYLRANVKVLFCNNAHTLSHQNGLLDLTNKSPEKGPPVPRDKR